MWCVDSTHKTCTSFNDYADSCYLFTIVVVNPVTNQGVPVCFFITDAETSTVIAQWFKWVQEAVGELSVNQIMIDCSQTEVAAIRQAFGSSVSILLCHWHIKRSWEKHLKSKVKVALSTGKDTTKEQDAVRAAMNRIMRATTVEACENEFQQFKAMYSVCYKTFFDYFEGTWYSRKHLWVNAYRPDARFDTNNYIESYHNQLKTFWLGRRRNRRVDRLVHTLSHAVISNYRRNAIQAMFSISAVELNAKEKASKSRADEVSDDNGVRMISEDQEGVSQYIWYR